MSVTLANFDAAKFREDLEQVEAQCRDLFDRIKERQSPGDEPRASIVNAIAQVQAAKIGARKL